MEVPADPCVDACSFCGRTAPEMQRMIATEDRAVRICDRCIDEFYRVIHEDDAPDGHSIN